MKSLVTGVAGFIGSHLAERLILEGHRVCGIDGFLGNYSRNKYRFVPETQEATFGTINQALRLTVYFDGQEIDDFTTYFGAFTTNYHTKENLFLKFTSSAFQSLESETFDVDGAYRLDELERDLSKSNFGDVAFNRGVGSYLHHARNYLQARVFNAEHNGKKILNRQTFLWGIKYQNENIQDERREWKMIDSAGYSIPQEPENEIILNELI